MSGEYHQSYLIGILLFNDGDFFEAHEHWEDAWNDATGDERDFYKGLIQTAVGLCHLYNGNARGARRLYYSSNALLKRFRPTHQGLDLDRLAETVELCFMPALDASEPNWIAGQTQLSLRLDLVPEPITWPSIPEAE